MSGTAPTLYSHIRVGAPLTRIHKRTQTSFSFSTPPVSLSVGFNVQERACEWFEYHHPSSLPPSINTTYSNMDSSIRRCRNIMVLRDLYKFDARTITSTIECVYT